MPINVAADRWYRPLYEAVHDGLISLGLTHVNVAGPGVAVRGPGNASDVPPEFFYLPLHQDLVLLLQTRGVLKNGKLLFTIGNFLSHLGLTRILREYSSAGSAFPVAPVLRDPLHWPDHKEERILNGGEPWISKQIGADQLSNVGTLWAEAIGSRLITRLKLMNESEFLQSVLSERDHTAYKVACYLYLGNFELAKEIAFLVHQKHKQSSPVSASVRAQSMRVCDQDFLDRVLASCDARELILKEPPPSHFPGLR